MPTKKEQSPKVIVYGLRPRGQPGQAADDLSKTIVTFAAWRCDGLVSPEADVNAGSVPFELGDSVKEIQGKIVEEIVAMYKVKQEDIVFLA